MRLSWYRRSRAKASLSEPPPFASFGQVMEGAGGDALPSCRGASAPGHLAEGRLSPRAAAVAPGRTEQKDGRPGRDGGAVRQGVSGYRSPTRVPSEQEADVRLAYLFAVGPLPRSRVSSARRCRRGRWPLAQRPSADNGGLLGGGTAARPGEIDLRVLRRDDAVGLLGFGA